MSNLETTRAQRLDQKVVALLPELSRAFAARLIADGKVSVNGALQIKAGHKLREGDEVRVDYDTSKLEQIPKINLPILYEDRECVVINKPVGILSHSKGAANPEATVATWLRSRLRGLDGERGGIVHRLDRATSGVMICAKTPEALSWLQRQFANRKVKKTYAAVVQGTLDLKEAIIDMPIGRNPKAPATFRVDPQGKSAITAYKVLASNGSYSLLQLRPETGRTHQLRVHLNHLHHPILGDTMYGGQSAERLYLHAELLEITILEGHERKIFTAPTPTAFKELVS